MSTPNRPGQATKVRIASAGDLFGALRSDSASLRLFVLKAIAADPHKALSYGAFQGGELYEEVVSHWQRSDLDTDQRAVALAALVALDGDRVLALCKSDFSFSRNRGVLRVAASRLAHEPAEELGPFLRRFLFDDGLSTRTRLTATLLRGVPSLSPRERVRISIISIEQNTPLPPLPDPDTEEFWVSELKGLWAEEAKVLAEGLGEEAFRGLARAWNGLPEDAHLWLIQWGMRDHPLHAAALVADVLRGDQTSLVRAALQCLGEKQAMQTLFQSRLNELVGHPLPEVRAAALLAGGTLPAPLTRKMLLSEPTEVRLALIRSLAQAQEREYAPDLAELLRDGDWRIRAAASMALAELAGASLEALKPLLADPDESVRIAAMNTLLLRGGAVLVAESVAENVAVA